MQRVLEMGLNPELHLDNLILGQNSVVIEALKDRVKKTEQPIYLHGEHSCGKTHILQALTSFYLGHNLNGIYFDLASDYNLSDFVEVMLEADVVLLDNLDATSLEVQKIIFDIFNNSMDRFNLIISGTHPTAILEIFPDLHTRIMQALSSKVYSLNDSQQIEALLLRAKYKNIHIKRDIFKYLQVYYFRDLSKLMSAIDILDKESLLQKKQITKKMLKEIF